MLWVGIIPGRDGGAGLPGRAPNLLGIQNRTSAFLGAARHCTRGNDRWLWLPAGRIERHRWRDPDPFVRGRWRGR